MRFFVDNCLSRKIVGALRSLGVDATHITEWPGFDGGTLDLEWMPVIGVEGLIAVTDDNRIRKRPAERKARADAQLTTVFLAERLSNLQMWDQATKVIACWPKIEHAVRKARRGQCFLVALNGKVEVLRNP